MLIADVFLFTVRALRGARMRTVLMLIAMAIGVAAVVILTSLGEGARRYVINEFSSLGTNLLIVIPGRSETQGAGVAFVSVTTRDLTLDDALALERSPHVRRQAPIVVGSAPVSYRQKDREVLIVGSTRDFFKVRRLSLSQGRFIELKDIHRGSPVCVIGQTVRDELFGPRPALGEWVRIGDRRFRVVGILASKGQSLGVDVDELAVIPVASAQALLNAPSLFRILVEARSREEIEAAKRDVLRILKERHEGEEDVTVITQDAVLATFDRILKALTYTVAGIAGISLVVAGILIMNVMLVAVTQRRAEIGLLKAVGAPARGILVLFVAEAALLSLVGAGLGLVIGYAADAVIGRIYPSLPLGPPWWAVIAAAAVALGTGIAFSLFPARRAARLDPVTALSQR